VNVRQKLIGSVQCRFQNNRVAFVAIPLNHIPPQLRPKRSQCRMIFSESSRRPFSAAHFLGHCFRLILAAGSFASSAFPFAPEELWVSSHKAAARFENQSALRNGAPIHRALFPAG